MFRSNLTSNPARGRVRANRPNRANLLRGEALESRLTLNGTVTVTLAGTSLNIVGDIDANDVLIKKGPNPNEIVIEGKNRAGDITTFINGPTLIDDPVSQINVDLWGGSDDFRIVGNSPQDRFVVPGPLSIVNRDGNNTNRLENVVLASTFNVSKASGSSESNLEVVGTDVVGVANINNNNGGQGPSKTVFSSQTTFQNNVMLNNGDGKDILVVDNSNVNGNFSITNGNGDTRTVFGMSEDPIVYGDLTISNMMGNDTFVLNDTTVWGKVTISYWDGHTDTTVSQANVGIGLPAAAGNIVFDLDARVGTDSFMMTDTVINDGMDLEFAANTSETYGTIVDISDSTIKGNAAIRTDNGYDRVNIDPTTIGRDLTLYLYDGSSDVTLADLVVGLNLTITANNGTDHVIMERTTVQGNTVINLGNGIDRLEILDASALLGQTTLTSGAGIDTFVRQVGPGPQAVDIVFLLLEDFELDDFVL